MSAPNDYGRWYSLELQDLPIQLAANLGFGDTANAIILTIRKRRR